MLQHYITRGGKTLRCGYTTGACAAGAAAGATELLLSGTAPQRVRLDTPRDVSLTLDILEPELSGEWASCAVRKDSGDDPDVTDGALVFARVRRTDSGIRIDGGEGVGRVTRLGLDQPVGGAAINSTPRRMISEAVGAVCRRFGYAGGLEIVISVPGGEALAKRTFNPRLGIEGGISIIGTTGIVEPMSSAALVDTIRLELSVLAASGEKGALLCPGNYGEDFAREALGLSLRAQVSIGNFIGEAIDAAVEAGFERLLLVGHIGKLVKLGIGMMNTHSAWGDGRMETLAACALRGGGEAPLLRGLLDCATTDAALELLDRAGLLDVTMSELGGRIQASLERRVPPEVQIGFICFTNAAAHRGILTRSDNAEALAAQWRKASDE